MSYDRSCVGVTDPKSQFDFWSLLLSVVLVLFESETTSTPTVGRPEYLVNLDPSESGWRDFSTLSESRRRSATVATRFRDLLSQSTRASRSFARGPPRSSRRRVGQSPTSLKRGTDWTRTSLSLIRVGRVRTARSGV